MQPIRLHINRLGLVSNSDITITPLMIFSGESGLGKSYVAILCHYFFYVWLNPKRLDSFFKGIQQNRGINFFDSNQKMPDIGEALSITKVEIEEWLAKDAVSYLRFMLGTEGLVADIQVKMPDSIPESITFTFEQELVGINNAEEIYYKLNVLKLTYRFRGLGIQDESPYAYLFRFAVIGVLLDDFRNLDFDFVLPPSRGSYLSEDIHPISGLYKSFVDGMKSLEQAQELPNVVNNKDVDLLKKVLEGDVKKTGDNYVYVTNSETMPISAAASSVREIGPLQMLITKRNVARVSVLFEEPEAHLHPLKQRKMADLIVAMAMSGAKIQITTHSDYFLRRINDLLRLNLLKTKKTEEEFQDICKKNNFDCELTLDPSILSAYYLEKDNEGNVSVQKQETSSGIPFDTFKYINGKPLTDSSLIYDLAID